jgi:iron-sulfur cluster repair protein YtfE (RIC family)
MMYGFHRIPDLPAPGEAGIMPSATAARPDTYDMVLVHRVFRRELGAAPYLVRGVAPGNAQRAAVVARHIALLLIDLHLHHSGEDELLWPRLRESADVDPALVARMEAQHERISALVDKADGLLPVWRDNPEDSTTRGLADILEQLTAELDSHLGEEEAEILPLVAVHFTAAEWEELGERGMEGIAKSRPLWALSALLEGADEAERAKFMANVPLPARLTWRLIGRWRYRRSQERVYGTA